jgi:hypothetical protein|tara:strand:- start:416 stop:778 length:363 start_codon:yes stop_codon:yes gene_type:complete
MKTLITAAIISIVTASTASAAVCDYRPSQSIAAATVAIAGATTATATTIAAVSPYYAIGGMVGSTSAGISGAGTVGIIAGTAGTIGATTIAVLTSPITITAGVVALATATVYEGACALTN